MRDVFISYHEKSAEKLAPRIADALESAGISCWYAPPNKPLTVSFTEEIVQALEDCKVFLLIWNEKSLHSVRVATETALAVRGFGDNRKRKLVAFRVDDVGAEGQLNAFLDELRARDDFPSDIAPFRIADGYPPDERHIAELLNLLKQFLKEQELLTALAALEDTLKELQDSPLRISHLISQGITVGASYLNVGDYDSARKCFERTVDILKHEDKEAYKVNTLKTLNVVHKIISQVTSQ